MAFSPPIGRKNVLVTGGAGFIGSHLCDVLIRDANVICLDNLSTGDVANIEHLLQNPNFEFINHDITQPFQWADYPELRRFKTHIQGVQEIYHLACPISKKHFEDYKIASILTSSIGTKNILDLAVASKAKVLFASSSALYGAKGLVSGRVSETDPCGVDHLTPTGAYDEGKRFSEAILYTYAATHGLEMKISRLFRTYGPRMKIADGNLIPDMVNAALDGHDVELACGPEETICLCYVADAVDGLVKHMNSPVDVTLVNIGSDLAVPVFEVAELILRLTNTAAKVRCEPSLPPVKEAPVPDITRARQLLRWMPLTRLEDGLQKAIDDARSRRQRLRSF